MTFKNIYKILGFLICFFSPLICISESESVQFREEMQILQMFYQDKDLVISATRNPKPVSQVAENMTVITAEEIDAMNAHSIAEVLKRMPGIFLSAYNQDFGAASLVTIQGSDPIHVRVLLDGVTWNFLGSGAAEVNSIPVGIVKRIEVIKGPASSAWGSSLGGVVNIITKSAGDIKKPSGSVKVSYGERSTQDYSAEIFGSAGPVGCYFFGGSQKSDGLRNSRDFENNSFFSRFNLSVSKDVHIGLTAGYSEPETIFGELSYLDSVSKGSDRSFFSMASLKAAIADNLELNLDFHFFKQKFTQKVESYGLPDFSSKSKFDENTLGGSVNLVWHNRMHTTVIGFDVDHGSLAQTSTIEYQGVYARLKTEPDIDRWAVYANDTFLFDKFSITPGIRYDHNTKTGSFVSPSLGATYTVSKATLLRASVARGFTIPPLSYTSGGSFGLNPNHSLDSEEVWSYQAGAESTAARYLWIRGTFFYHELKKAIVLKSSRMSETSHFINKGTVRRQGVELESETLPFYNISLTAGFAFVRSDRSGKLGTLDAYTYSLGVKYDDKKSFNAELFGHYVWWNIDKIYGAEYNDFIWDININKKIFSGSLFDAELFCAGHNIFNGAQYVVSYSKNPKRWIEAGVKVKF